MILIPIENRGRTNVPTQNLGALEAYLRGNDVLLTALPSRMDEAAELFQEAIELDPAFTLAFVGLAKSYVSFDWDSDQMTPEMREKLLAVSARAMQLDDSLVEVQMLNGQVKLMQNDLEGARAVLDRVLETSPNNAEVYFQLSHWHLKSEGMDAPSDRVLGSV